MAYFLVAKLHLGMSVSTCSRALLNNSSSLSASRCWPQLQSSALTPTPFHRFPTGKLLHCNYIHNREVLVESIGEALDATDRWEEYVTKWTAWNHMRVAAALAATALLTIALHAG